MRRSKSTERVVRKSPASVNGTIGRIIRQAKKTVVDVSPTAETQPQLSPGVHGVIKGTDNLSPSQQQAIANIITSDIARFCTTGNSRQSYIEN